MRCMSCGKPIAHLWAEYKKRVIQLGENPHFVFNVGGLGVDCIKNTKLLNKTKLEALLETKLLTKNLLITLVH